MVYPELPNEIRAVRPRVTYEVRYNLPISKLRGVPERARLALKVQRVTTCEQLLGAAGSFDAQRAQPMTWLTSIARHRAIDSLRRRQAEPQWVTARASVDDGEDDDLLDQLASDTAGPLELLGQAVQARAVGVCMKGLSGEQQQTLALAFYQGLSHSEVAEQLRQPLGTVKSWVRRGLIALRGCLERAGAIDPVGT
mgnify:CR=1 FL=1